MTLASPVLPAVVPDVYEHQSKHVSDSGAGEHNYGLDLPACRQKLLPDQHEASQY
jgi:hypothetical protein